MVDNFEEIRTRTPANPKGAPQEAIMPQMAWEALLRDVVQGLRPPYTPKPPRQWLQATHRHAWAISAPQTPPPPHDHHTGKEKGHGQGEGKGQKGTLRQGGKEGPKVTGRCP